MDEDEEYADVREDLLNRFRASLSKPMSERYFDEDDLIEIFDFAGDLNDDYLRMEALMCGARYFPDSLELLERRGIFYSQYSDDARKEFLDDNTGVKSLILEILELRNDPPDADEAINKFNEILSRQGLLSDEEVIQFIDLVSSTDQYQWIKDNIEKLRKKAKYLNVMLYEIAIAAETNRDYQLSAMLLEELTQLEPFNSYYWLLLSKQYAELEDGEKALSAIDYSLAIKPDFPQAVLIKAKLCYALEHPAQEVINMLEQLLKQGIDDLECTLYLASIYNNVGRRAEACRLLEDTLAKVPTSQKIEIIPELISYNPENVDSLLDYFYRLTDDNNQLVWASWAQQQSIQGNIAMAKRIINAYQRNSGIKLTSLFGIEDLFVNKEFKETIEQLTDYIHDIGANETDFPSILAMQIISLLKSGATYKALALCEFCIDNINFDKYPTVSSRLEFMGLRALIQSILNRISKPSNASDINDWDDFDPLHLWS